MTHCGYRSEQDPGAGNRERGLCGRAGRSLVFLAIVALAAPAFGLTISNFRVMGYVEHQNGFMNGAGGVVNPPQSTTPAVLYSGTVATAGKGESTALFSASYQSSDVGFEFFIGEGVGVTQTDWSPDSNGPASLLGAVLLYFDAEGPGDIEIRASFTISGLVPTAGWVEVLAAAASDDLVNISNLPLCWVSESCAYQDIKSFLIEEPGPFSRQVDLAYTVPDVAEIIESLELDFGSVVALYIRLANDGGPVSAFVESASFGASTVPEPTTALLLACGLAGLAAAGKRRPLR